MTLLEIITSYLQAHGLDGLVSEDCDCACVIGDLAPCGNPQMTCAGGVKVNWRDRALKAEAALPTVKPIGDQRRTNYIRWLEDYASFAKGFEDEPAGMSRCEYRRALMRVRRDLDAIQRNFRVRMPKAWRLPPQ